MGKSLHSLLEHLKLNSSVPQNLVNNKNNYMKKETHSTQKIVLNSPHRPDFIKASLLENRFSLHSKTSQMKSLFSSFPKSLAIIILSLVMSFVTNTSRAQVINEGFEEAAFATGAAGTYTNNVTAYVSTTAASLSTYNTGNWILNSGNVFTAAVGTKSSLVRSGTKSIALAASSSAFLITPVITSGVTSVTLYVCTGSSTGAVNMYVLTNTNSTFTSVAANLSGTATNGAWANVSSGFTVNSTAGYSQITYNLSGLTNASSVPCMIKFQRSSSNVAIDDIVITTPPSCVTAGTSNPSATSSCIGTAASMSVTATGTTPTYQWQYSANNSTGWASVADGTPANITYTGNTTNTLSITPATGATTGAGGYYRCVVSVACGGGSTATSSGAQLTVNQPIVIGTNPSANTATISGSAITMSVSSVTGSSPTYQWTRSSTAGGVYSNVVDGTPTGVTYSGNTTATLSITADGTASAGTANFYKCVVSGSSPCGSATSTSAALTIQSAGLTSPPTISAAASQTVDNNLVITYTNDPAWNSAVTGITVDNGSVLAIAGNTYFTTPASGTFSILTSAIPALQSSGSHTIAVKATGYNDATVTQTTIAGAPTQLAIKTALATPATNTAVFATQPAVYIEDQYGNVTTSTATVIPTVTSGQTWLIGGAQSSGLAAVAGTATFTNLTAGSTGLVLYSGATITFTCGALTSVISASFTIPAFVSSTTDYFRSNGTGGGTWATAGTWQGSHDNINWGTATLAPTSTATSVVVRSGDAVSVGTILSTPLTTVDAGGTLSSTVGLTLAGNLNINGTLTTSNTVVTTGYVLTVLGTWNNSSTTTTAITSTAGTLLFATAGGAGTYTLTGTATQVPTATWRNGSNYSTLNFNSTGTVTVSSANQNYGDWVIGANGKSFSLAGSPYNIRNLTVNSSITQLTTGGTGSTITINTTNFSQTTGTMNLTAYATTINLNVSGNFSTTSGATLSQTSGTAATVTLNGGSAQTVTTSGAINGVLGIAIANTSGGVALAAPLTTAGTLTLTSGKLTTTAINTCTVGATSGGSATAYVSGPLTITLPSAASTVYTFPVGSATAYLPCALTVATSAATSTATVQAISSNSGGSADGTSLTAISSSEYWSVTTTGSVITSITASLGKASLSTFNVVGLSSTLAGSYSSIDGTTGATVGGINGIGVSSTVTASPSVAGTYYLVLGTAACFTANTSNPSAISACIGTATTMSVSATGTAATYSWQYSANNSTGWASVANGTPANITYSGNTTNTLSITAATGATTGAGGYYRCVVSVTCDASTVNSNGAQLTVSQPIAIGTSPSAATVAISGAATTMSVSSVTGTSPVYQWQRASSAGGVYSNVVDGTPTGVTYSGSTTATLSISAGITASTGTNDYYKCVVSGTAPCGSVSSGNASLTINSAVSLTPPTLSSSSQSVDGDFVITYANDAAWNGNVTGITVDGGSVLSLSTGPNTYFSTPAAGSISIHTSAIPDLQTAGTHTIVVIATGYNNAILGTAATIAGSATKLTIASITTPQTAGTSFNVIVNAFDQYDNAANSTASVTLSASGTGILSGNTGALVGGTRTFSVGYTKAESVTFTAAASGLTTSLSSNSVSFNAGTATKLQLLMPGETAAPGTVSGKTGSPTAQTAGTALTVTVNAVDANWNLVNSNTHTINITSSDAAATLSAAAALVAGTKTFSVTLKTAGSFTITATDANVTPLTANTGTSTTVNAGVATKLVISAIGTQSVNAPFNVTITSTDANSNPANVTGTTTITLTKATGAAGAYSGTLTGSITAGSNSVTISGVIYNTVETTSLTATASGGTPALTAGTSATFSVTNTTYYSKTSGSMNWTDATWGISAGGPFNQSISSSGADLVVIQSGGTVNLNTNYTSVTGGTITVNGTLNITSNYKLTAAANFTISSGANLNIANSASTVATNASATNGTLEITAGTFTITGTMTVNGYFKNSDATAVVNTVGTLSFGNYSVYELNNTSISTVPTATWNANATLLFSACSTSSSSTFTVNNTHYGNILVNTTGGFYLSGNNANPNIFIDGSFTVTSTNNGTLKLFSTTGSATRNLTILGDFTTSGATYILQYDNSGAATGLNTMSVGGNLSGALFNNTTGATPTTSTLSLTGTGKTINTTCGFAKWAVKVASGASYTLGANLALNTSSPYATFQNDGILDCNTYVISGSSNVAATFTLSSGATLKTANTSGLATVISTFGTKTFTAGANYVFNGATTTPFGAALTTGNPADVAFNANVTLDKPITMTGTLTLGAVLTTTATNLLTLGTASTITDATPSSYYVSGPLAWSLPLVASATKYSFPIGTATAYLPADITLTTSGTGSTVKVQATTTATGTADGTTLTSVSNAEYWTLTTTGSVLTALQASLGKASLGSNFTLGTSTSANGSYVSIGGNTGITVGGINGIGLSTVTATPGTAGVFYLQLAVPAAPTLTAAVGATVDGSFTVTYLANATWKSSITGITVDGTTLDPSAYSTSTAGQITFTPSASSLLQSSNSKSIAVIATNYSNATVTQTIGAGAANKLAIATQPTNPSINGAVLGTQPVITIVDRYGNATSSTASVVASVGTGAWTIGGTTTKAAVSGTATFTNITAGKASAATGVTINFTSSGLTGITSTGFNIPAIAAAIGAGTIADFGNITVNQTLQNSVVLTGAYLNGTAITVTAPTGFVVSLSSGSGFASSVTISGYGTSFSRTIYVKFQPTAVQSYNANLTYSGGGIASQDLALTGSGVAVTPVSGLSITNTSDNIQRIAWSAPSGSYDKVLVFVGRSLSSYTPSGAGSAYTGANANIALASPYGSTDSLVYSGTGTNVEVTGLSANTTYYYTLVAYSGNAYSSTVTANGLTAVQPVTALTASTASAQSVISWTNPTYNATQSNYWNDVMVIASTGSITAPSGNSYTANAVFGTSGTSDGNGGYVIYKGTGTTVTVTNLSNFVAYNYGVFVRHGNVWSAVTSASSTPNSYLVGDYGSVATGTWSVASIWKTWDGTAFTGTAATAPTSSTNVYIVGGYTVTLGASGSCKNLNVLNGRLTAGSTTKTPVMLSVSGTQVYVTSGGILGSNTGLTGGDAADALGINITTTGTNPTFTISGPTPSSGVVNIGRIINTISGSTVVINHDVIVNYHGSSNTGNASGYHSTVSGNTLTINGGSTLTFAPWSCYLVNGSSNSIPAFNQIINVNGTMTFAPGNPTGNTSAAAWTGHYTNYMALASSGTVALNIGSGGVLNTTHFYPNGTSQHASTASIISIVNNGTININDTSDFRKVSPYQTITGTGTVNINAGQMSIGHAAGITSSGAAGPIQTTIRNYSSSASYNYAGAAAQVAGSGLPSSVIGLSLNNNAGLTLSSNVSVTGTQLSVNGTISGGTITMAGSSAQTVSGTGIVNNFTVNNTAGVTVSSGSNSLGVSGVLTLQSGNLTTNGNVTLKSLSIANSGILAPYGASGNAGTITGNVTVERYIPKGYRAYRDISASGVYSASNYLFNTWQESGSYANSGYGMFITGILDTLVRHNSVDATYGIDHSLTGNASAFYYRAGWDTVKNTKTELLNPYQSYRVLVRGDRSFDLDTSGVVMVTGPTQLAMNRATTLRASGSLITGNVTFTTSGVSNGVYANNIGLNAASNGYTYVANPYAAPIDFHNIYTSGRLTNIDPRYYYLDPTIGSTGSYVSYNAVSGVSSNNATYGQFIQAGQGFLIGNTSSSPQLIITEDDKSILSTSRTSVFGATTPNSKMAFTLLKQGAGATAKMDGAVAVFGAQFSNAIGVEDNVKMSNASDNLSILEAGKSLSIDGRLPVTVNDVLGINIGSLSGTTYQLEIDATAYSSNGLTAYLRDAYKNTTVALAAGMNTISFTADTKVAATYQNRFSIIFKPSTLSVNSIVATATVNGSVATITWNTVGEKEVAKFEVEKSTDGASFTQIAEQVAKNTASASYTTTDNAATAAANYYRIKAVSTDGTITYSNTAKLTTNNLQLTTIYPNPLTGKTLNVQLGNVVAGKYKISVTNTLGQKVAESTIVHVGANGTHTVNINSTIATGVYNVVITSIESNQTIYQTSLSIQK